jgi:phenylpropionate dioxygenase-like ring-hydroxylating dioxygenase large terminal subunit
MNRKELVQMARRNLEHVKAGSVDQAVDVHRVPSAHYVDADRWAREMELVFRRLPLVLAFSAELREAGDYRSMIVADVPILLTRGSDGAVRAFSNVCRHRGAVVAPEGSGNATRFVCPYHGWSYDAKGSLRGIYNQKDFGEIDKACHGLAPLPVYERAGLIWGALTPKCSIDFDRFLGGYDELLEGLGLADAHLVGRQVVEGPGWKIAYDGYLDFYHLPILHRESFGPDIPSDALYDAYGPHQRVSMPNPGLLEFDSIPEDDWPLEQILGGVWTVFPHISIADFDAEGKLFMISQLFPGTTLDTSTTIQNFLAVDEPSPETQKVIEEQMAFLFKVVRDEDYAMGKRIQRTLEAGSARDVLFGRNELGGQRFHRWVDAILETKDEDLDELFARGIDPAR